MSARTIIPRAALEPVSNLFPVNLKQSASSLGSLVPSNRGMYGACQYECAMPKSDDLPENEVSGAVSIRAQDPSEELIFGHCRRLFFPLWSYLNPLCPDGSELCDVLVAFGDHILIISVKRVDFDPDAANAAVQAERWRKRAIEKSLRQALGAKRFLIQQGRYEVRGRGMTSTVVIDNIGAKRIHCISVSLGGKGWIPYGLGQENDKPEDFVHIFTEESLDTLLGELTTINDFTRYLREKEEFFGRTTGLIIESELDLLALYVRDNRKLPDWSGQDLVLLDGGHWRKLAKQAEYKDRLLRDQVSELWDHIVAELVKSQLGNTYIAGTGKETLEPLLRQLAAEPRFNRRVLSKALIGLLQGDDIRARIAMSPDGELYVFMRVPRDEEQKGIFAELTARCHVAIGLLRDRLKVLRAVGVATQPIDGNPLRSHIAAMVSYPEWTPQRQSEMEKLQAGGLFKTPRIGSYVENEYRDMPKKSKLAPKAKKRKSK